MKKRSNALLLTGLIFFPVQISSAKVWVVNANGTGDFTTLTAAISSVASGDTIFVAAGGYVESPSATTKKLTILGVGFNSPAATTWSITLNSSLNLGEGSTISGLELTGITIPIIQVVNKNITIEKCHIVLSTGANTKNDGIDVVGVDSCTIRQNIIENGATAISVTGSPFGVKITNNILAKFAGGIILGIGSGGDEVVANNTLVGGNNCVGLGISVSGNPPGTFSGKVYSNIFYGFGLNYSLALSISGTFYLAYNSFEAPQWTPNTPWATGSIFGNPSFVNYSTPFIYGVSDLHLGLGSPCTDTGEPNVGNNDRDGSRNDRGVYGGPNQFDDTGAPMYPAVITVVVSPYAAPLNGAITIKVLGRIGQ